MATINLVFDLRVAMFLKDQRLSHFEIIMDNNAFESLLLLTLSCRIEGMPINMDILLAIYTSLLSLKPLYHSRL